MTSSGERDRTSVEGSQDFSGDKILNEFMNNAAVQTRSIELNKGKEKVR